MLTYAIGFVQDVQLICFALVLGFIALQNRRDLSLRWFCFAYISGLVGALLDFGAPYLPRWASLGLALEAAPIGYACINASVVHFTRHGWITRRISLAMVVAALPLFLFWADRAHMSENATLTDFLLAVQTLITVVVILTSSDHETRWPRGTIGAFLGVYSAVEFLRVGLFLATGKMPGKVIPSAEIVSGIVYVVSCSVLPLAFIWMTNVRLLAHLNRQAVIDPLTALLNRRGIEAAVEEQLDAALHSDEEFAFVLADLDHFKRVNDQFGHVCGDQALRNMADYLRKSVRAYDLVGRLGGEEFLIVLRGVQPAEARELVDELRAGLRKQILQVDGKTLVLTASFGIALSAHRPHLTWELLLREADIALYAAKNAGRDATRVFSQAMAATARQ